MNVPIHRSTTAACRDLLTDLTRRRTAQPVDLTQCPISRVIPEEELSSQIRPIIEKVQTDYNTRVDSKHIVDILKAHFEVTGREVILDVAETEISLDSSDRNAKWQFVAKLYDACDIIRILFTIASSVFVPVAESSTSKPPPKWDPIVMFMSIIDELVELLSIDSWNVFFGYFESRQELLTGGRLLAGVRALYFLKPLNGLLRITSRSGYAHPSTTFATFEEYLESGSTAQSTGSSISESASELELRGRIHILMSGLFKLSDQSATNSRGAYADMLLDYEQIANQSSNPSEGEMTAMEESEMDVSNNRASGRSSELYDAVCALQRFFSNPAGIAATPTGENSQTGLQEFKRVTGLLLSAFSTCEVHPPQDSSVTPNLFMPRYIPSRDALESQLGELEFRRQLCVQLLIILQQIQNLHVKDKARHPKDLHFPASFSVETEDYEWARRQAGAVHGELARMPGGREFDSLVSSILSRERNHAIWKHVGCPAFEREPISDEAAEEEIKKAEARRKAIIAPLPPFAHAAGTKALSQLSRNPLTSVEQLKKRKVTETVKDLQDKWNNVDFDEGMGGSPREFLEPKASLSWRALRLVLEDDFDIFEKLKDKYDPNEIVKVQEEIMKNTAEAAQPTASAMGTPNPPPTATFAAESDGEVKDTVAEVDVSMPGPEPDELMQSGSNGADLDKKPLMEATSEDNQHVMPEESETPAPAPEMSNDINMK